MTLTVTGKDGLSGTLETSLLLDGDELRTLVRLDTGQQVTVPSEVLASRADGSYYLPFSLSELASQYDVIESPDLPLFAGQSGASSIALAEPSGTALLPYKRDSVIIVSI